ncbi:MAG: DUF4147 domain-containing protein [Acidimicrobiia bacterium]
MPTELDVASKRTHVRRWLDVALEAVEPRRLVSEAVSEGRRGDTTIIAIGKASVAMTWGANDALGNVRGVCVSNVVGEVPPGVELLVGDHPVPAERSLAAGARVLEVAAAASGPVLALISGGGSALCEHPLPGVDPDYLIRVNQRLLDAGAPIEDINLIRQHLSALKGGGVARAVQQEVETLVLGDVAGGDPAVVASGPTIAAGRNPDKVKRLLTEYGVFLDPDAATAIESAPGGTDRIGPVELLADGRTAGEAIVDETDTAGISGILVDRWIHDDVVSEIEALMARHIRGVVVAVGEPCLRVDADGRGGRNTHAALLAARRLAGTSGVFAAFATDGVDGRSGSAGAMVDGGTLDRGGFPDDAIEHFDSASYLERSGDLIATGPTGTNVSDVWVLWK